MNRLLFAGNIFNKKKISDVINKFINTNESIINDKINKECDLNTYPLDKEDIIKKILKETKSINLDNNGELSKEKQKQILKKIISEVEANSKKLQAKYNDEFVKEIDNLTVDANITLSNDVINTIIIQMMDFIQIYITNSKTLIDDNAINDKLKYYVNNEIEKGQSEQVDVQENQEDQNNTNIQETKTYQIEYADTPDTQVAFEELKQIMQNANPFSITDVKTPQVANKGSRLKKIAHKNILAVQDLFAYLRNNGFDINLVQNGMIATYYEGFNPFILDGTSDVIFYYDNSVVAKMNSRLKKLADQEALPSPDAQLALPAGNLESGYYIVTEDLQHHMENSFEAAEKWLLDNRKNVVIREVINSSYISGNLWEEREKEIYKKINDIRYEDGPKNDVNFKVVDITIPNDQTFIDAYKDWLNKYKKLFKAYDD